MKILKINKRPGREAAGRRLISLLLSFIMVLSVVLARVPAVVVRAEYESPYAELVCMSGDTSSLQGKEVEFNDIEWYIIKDESNAVDEGSVTLVKCNSVEDTVDLDNYDYNADNEAYDGSALIGELSDYYNNNFFGEIKGAILDDKVFVLNKNEIDNMPDQIKSNHSYCWIATDSDFKYLNMMVCNKNTLAISYIKIDDLGVACFCPVIKLDLSKVDFNESTRTFSLKTSAIENSVTITAGGNMTKTEDSGEASQTGLSGAMGNVVYNANDGYKFPETDDAYTTTNGITVAVSQDQKTITVSGTPTADTNITIPDAVVAATHVHNDITFTAWTATDSMPTEAGNYYLANDVTINSTWNIPSGTTNLCLNGHGIIMSGENRVMTVSSGCTLNLYDCGTEEHRFTVQNPSTGGAGLAQVDDSLNGGYQTFTGGYITGGKDYNKGGGVYVDGGTFIMAGGNIIGNEIMWKEIIEEGGGGVALSSSGSSRFVMTGGTIQYNTSVGRGGGLSIENNATAELSGVAKIAYNCSNDNDWGGGISSFGELSISGNVRITNNRGESALHPQQGSLRISGAPFIFDNETSTCNILPDVKINVVEALTEGAKLGVYLGNGGVFTNSTKTSFNDASKFTSDNPNYAVMKNVDGQLYLGSGCTVTFNANGHGTAPDAQTVASGEKATKPTDLTAEGYVFDGWYKEEALTNKWNFDSDTVTENITLYAKWRQAISYAVTFKVVNGKWDDDSIADKTVTLTGYEGDTLKLIADQIPAVGTKPNDTYKAGSWDITPSTDTEITAVTIFTYTYAQKDSISQTVTFKVVNGKWDDDSTADKTVTLTGYEGDTLKLTADQIPGVGTKPNDTYKAGSWDITPSADIAITADTVYTYSYKLCDTKVKTAPKANTLTYDGSAQKLVSEGEAENGSMQYALGTEGAATGAFSASVPTATDAGTYYVWYKAVSDSGEGETDPASVTVTIAPANPKIPTGLTATYGQKLSDVTLPEGWAWDDTAASVGDAGSHSFKASYTASDKNYNSKKGEDLEVTVKKASITIAADDKSSAYRRALLPLTYKVSGDYVSSDDLGISLKTDATGTSVPGEYTISVSWNENKNYDAKLLTGKYIIVKDGVSVSVSGYSGTYDGKEHGISVEEAKSTSLLDIIADFFDGGDEGGEVYYSDESLSSSNYKSKGSTDPVTYKDAGTYKVYYYIESKYYDVSPVSGSKQVVIKKAPLTVTPKDQTITYGDEAKTNGISASGFVSGESESNLSGSAVVSSNYSKYGDVGSYTLTAAGLSSNNYEISYKEGKLTVNPYPLTFKWKETKIVYDGKEHTVTATPATLNGDSLTLSYADNRGTKAGKYKARIVGIGGEKAKNYSFDKNESSASYTWEITEAEKVEEQVEELTEEEAIEEEPEVTSSVELDTDTPDVVVNGLDAEAEALGGEDAENVNITMKVSKVESFSSQQSTAAEAIRSIAGGRNLTFFDIEVMSDIDSVRTIMTSTTNILEICIPYDPDYEGGLSAYRYHDGAAMTLTESNSMSDGTYRVDRSEKNVYIYTNKFSVYAIGYDVISHLDEEGNLVYDITGKISCDGLDGRVELVLYRDNAVCDKSSAYISGGSGSYVFRDLDSGYYRLVITNPDESGRFSVELPIGRIG